MSTEYKILETPDGNIWAAEGSCKLCLVLEDDDGYRPISSSLSAEDMAQAAIRLLEACGYQMSDGAWDRTLAHLQKFIR